LTIENARGLSPQDVTNLTQAVSKEAYRIRGSELMFELAQFVKDFLHKRNKPPDPRTSESFYETMVKNRLLEDQKRCEENLEKERKDREQLQNDILKRKEQLLRESRIRRNTTTSESSPRNSNSEDFRQEICDEHRRSETFFTLTGRKIQRGACLGHSMKGCINYSGIDLASGQLLYITEWSVKTADLEARGLKVESVIAEIEGKVTDLSKLRHKNLIAYEGVLCVKKKETLNILLVQEFLLGISLFSISGSLGWCPEGASLVAKGVLETLMFLHNHGVSHGNLLDSTVFMGSCGVIKLTDFSIVPFLQELINPGQLASADLPALGTLIESLIPTSGGLDMIDFITCCKSERTISSNDLLEHPFLSSMISNDHSQTPDDHNKVSMVPPRPVNLQMPFNDTSDESRLKKEFEMIGFIGKGAYGDVLKVSCLVTKQFLSFEF
jgi:eukaryotic translation initiation factor 2-alpha kinase 4